YELALKNIELNPHLEEKITLVNKGVSDKRETIKIRYNDNKGYGGASSLLSEGVYECDVETLTIEDILKEYDLRNPYLLKIDCEGCEDPIVLNCDLSAFEKIILEYHTFLTGTKHEKLVSKLEKQGFKVTTIDGDNKLGVIHLHRK
ncbi:MAG: FkbM family methyltransferase, partial [Methanobrevibacter sp.]|nr:FkbM family methyltransferase [Candidatus Methanovirga aequatorialis]